MEISATQMRKITDQSRFNIPKRSLPEIKTRKLTWSLEFSKRSNANSSRLQELASPKKPSYAYPENGDYNPGTGIRYLKTTQSRSISPKLQPPKDVERAPSPNTYNPIIQKTVVFAKIRSSPLKNEFEAAAQRANHVGPGWYNPEVGAEFQKQNVGFTLKSRVKSQENAVYSDTLYGQEIYDSIRFLEGGETRKINQSDRFRYEKVLKD
ncbi:hypothetical protein SS50377_28063 [Spironucleus salmonicida]|uniref:Uncharacterized protein n=1 Tax=Spironucleus salmonicida TaxID=348837 RepID=V6LDM6_9EUKA|nr:hypothetical protein SS50377_28063 [Spironucleus salmonicida]|eukprot:EST42615.1 Hypothetical protein SS50377_17935 [Spironucleus salmonicida]